MYTELKLKNDEISKLKKQIKILNERLSMVEPN